MRIAPSGIKSEIYHRFAKIYRAFGDFVDSGGLWDACIEAVSDGTLMAHIVFCNDVHQIPPAATFLRVRRDIDWDLTQLEKRSVGAFWGFVFKFVFGYRNQKSVVARVNTLRTATYFLDAPENVRIVHEHEGGSPGETRGGFD